MGYIPVVELSHGMSLVNEEIKDGMGLDWFRYIAGKFYNTKVVK